jgi:hypothetical protein
MTDSTTGTQCKTWNGNIVLVPKVNYNLMLFTTYGGFLENIKGDLSIICTDTPTDVSLACSDSLFDGFSKLKTAGTIAMSGCSTVCIFDLVSLTSLSGDLEFTDNPTLQEVQVYNLNSVNGSIRIQMDDTGPYRPDAVQMDAMQTVGGNINITGPVASVMQGNTHT